MSSVDAPAHYEAQRMPQPTTALPLQLSDSLLAKIRRHGEETYPHECCGILLGSVSTEAMTVHDALRAGNSRLDSAHNRYNIEPIDLIRAQRTARERSLDIVGFYHSHPDHPAFWSATDLAEAHWYGCTYVITSVDGTGGTPHAHQTNAFLLIGSNEEDKALARQPLVTVF